MPWKFEDERSANRKEKPCYLRISPPNTKAYVMLLSLPRTTIGSNRHVEIPLQDRLVADYHCDIIYQEKKFIIRSFHPNKILVNGLSMRRHRLCTGDRIQIGATELLFADHDPDHPEDVGMGWSELPDTGDPPIEKTGYVRVTQSGSKPVVIPLTLACTRIGSSLDAELPLKDSLVAEIHCDISYRGGRYFLWFYYGPGWIMNPVFINGNHVRNRRCQRLRPGDRIVIGATELIFFDKKPE